MLIIGGLTRCTTIDYPDELSAVIFCQGCPWRCIYCQNRHLLSAERHKSAPEWKQILEFLSGRIGLLDAVVFSGGEPTMQTGIVEAARMIRYMGFKIGLHTAGACPDRLEQLLPFLDWIGMDIKAPFEDYEMITGVENSGQLARSSAEIVRKSGVRHQFRTTVHPLLQQSERLARMKHMVSMEWDSCLVEQSLNNIELLTLAEE